MTLEVHIPKAISGGSKGAQGTHAPWGSKFFQFHAVFGKNWQNRILAPPGELARPPRGNPGSTPGNGTKTFTGVRLEIPQ